MSGTDRPRVYLAHGAADAEVAERFAEALREHGVRAWLAEWDVGLGQVIVAKHEEAIASAEVSLVLLTRAGLGDDWMRQVYAAMLTQAVADPGRLVIPVMDGVGYEQLPPMLRVRRGARIGDVESIAGAIHMAMEKVDALERAINEVAEPEPRGRLAAVVAQPSRAGVVPEPLLDDLIDELAHVIDDEGIARVLLERAGFPMSFLPRFSSSLVFWSRVMELVRNGALRHGVQAVVAQAVRLYPGNPFFARYGGAPVASNVDGARQGAPPSAQRRWLPEFPVSASNPSLDVRPPDPVAARLEAAYQRREQLVIDGKDTGAIDAEILELRRRKRHGPTLHPDEHLGQGRFRLLEVIGQGGFAVVWKAYDNKERRLVAVKVLHGELARVESRRERLFRGARRMAELQHPNVVRVLVPEGEELGFYYYVMELATGGDLHRAVVDGAIDPDQGLAVIESIADALAAAHEKGLVHRDVKPENILLRGDGVPVLSDFDLVQARDTTGGTRTTAMGSVIYAAPEQSEDASRVDHRADIYSLGMTAVFCIYGKRLPMTALRNHDAFLDGLVCTPELREVLQRAVAIDREQRFESITGFRQAFASARSHGAERSRVEVGEARRTPPDPRAGVVALVDRPSRTSPAVQVNHGIELVLVPGGRFLMGSPPGEDGRWLDEGPQHEVELVSFYLARTPVTNAQYEEYLRANPDAEQPKYWASEEYGQPRQPVVGVSWEEAQAYCKWAGLRLPTEAQWEYACRAGTTTRYCSGDREVDLARVGWYEGNSGRWLHPVGLLEPNAWGLYDMHGNVHEWCEDTWALNYQGAVHRPADGLRTQPVGGVDRAMRGGVFWDGARGARSAFRGWYEPHARWHGVGFRPALGHP